MKSSLTQNLPCPDTDDYGAGALYLQSLALAAETKMYAALNNFNAVVNRPTLIAQATVAETVSSATFVSGNIPANDDLAPDSQMSPAYIFNNTGSTLNSASFGTGPLPGMYRAGMALIMQPTGAVTAGTYRQLTVYVSKHFNLSNPDNFIASSSNVVFESNTGGEYATCEVVFRLDEIVDIYIAFCFSHGNTGSTVNVQPGSLFWLTYLGTNDLIEVV